MRRCLRRAACAAQGAGAQRRCVAVTQPPAGQRPDAEAAWGMKEGVPVYDPAGGNFEEVTAGGMKLYKGPGYGKTTEMFSFLGDEVGAMAGEVPGLQAGLYGAYTERHGALVAAFFARDRNNLQVVPETATRSVNYALARPVPQGKRLFLRSYVQHYFPGSRNLTVFTELVDPDPDPEDGKPIGPQACLRAVGNYYFLKDGQRFSDPEHKSHRGYVAFHPEMRKK